MASFRAGFTRAALLAVILVAAKAADALPPGELTAPQVAAEFLAAFNGGERMVYEGYLRGHGRGLKIADDYADMRAQTGGFEVVEPVEATGLRLREVVKAPLADDYFIFEVRLAPGPGTPIESLTFTPIDRPADIPPPPRVRPAGIGPVIDAELRAIGDYSGTVLVAANGRAFYARAQGLADRAAGTPITIDTRFRMASMGKMFTAVAILQLNQAGKLDLDSAVGTYLKDYPNAVFARTVTIRQLLTHTGGAGDFMSRAWADNIDRLNSPADYVALFGSRPPEFPPGSRFSYANYGFIVLGRIVETVSGLRYEDYLRTYVFGPAGMTRSGLNGPPVQLSVLATRYVKTVGGFAAPPAPFEGAATPAGGAYSTVGDLLAFADALQSHRLMDATHTTLLLSPKVKGDSGYYAFGFEVRDTDGVSDVGHDGGGPGQNGALRMLDNGRAVVVALSNVAPTWRADKLCAFIAARLRVK